MQSAIKFGIRKKENFILKINKRIDLFLKFVFI